MLLDLFVLCLRFLVGGYIRPNSCLCLPTDGPALVVANHPTVLDPVVLGLWAPRKIRFLVAGHLFDNPLMGWFFRWAGCIAVGREGAFEAAAAALERGDCLGIFPEGTITGAEELAAFRTGVARLALRTGAPVFPLGIAGTLRLFPPASAFLRSGPVTLCGDTGLRFDPGEELSDCLAVIRAELEAQVRRARERLEAARPPARLRVWLSAPVLVPLAFVLRRSER